MKRRLLSSYGLLLLWLPTNAAISQSVRIGANCRDGTTSTATGSGACSRHGGVASWRYAESQKESTSPMSKAQTEKQPLATKASEKVWVNRSSQREPTAVARNAFFVGVGEPERGDPSISDAVPWSVGYLRLADKGVSWGIDVAGEGTSLNNTSGHYDDVEQGLSLDLLVGKTLTLGSHWRVGAGVLAGIRQTGKSCADSYLGYECYADESPKMDIALNYGAMLHLVFKQALIGGRVSGESLQLMLGIAF